MDNAANVYQRKVEAGGKESISFVLGGCCFSDIILMSLMSKDPSKWNSGNPTSLARSSSLFLHLVVGGLTMPPFNSCVVYCSFSFIRTMFHIVVSLSEI